MRNAFFFLLAELGRVGVADVFSTALNGMTVLLKGLAPILKGIAVALKLLTIPFKLLARIIGRLAEGPMPLLLKIIGFVTGAILAAAIATNLWALAWVRLLAPILGMVALGTAIILIIEDLSVAVRGGSSVIGDMAAEGNFLASTFAQILLVIGNTIAFMVELTAAIFDLSFDGITDSLNRFIEALQRLNFVRRSSEFLTDLLASVLLDEDAALGQTTFVNPSPERTRAAAAAASGGMSVTVEVKGDTEVIAGVIATVNEGDLRQAQGEEAL